MTAPMRNRLAQRHQDERGYAALFMLGVLVLLTAVALGLLGSARGSLATSKSNADFLKAQAGLDQAYAYALRDINGTSPGPFPSGVARTAAFNQDLLSRSWTSNAATMSVTTVGRFRETTQSVVYPVRGKSVASWKNSGGTVSYGVTANRATGTDRVNHGLWGAAISTGTGTSTFAGTAPTWHLYSNSQVPAAPAAARVVAYSDGATSTGSSHGTLRSKLTAFMDGRQIDTMAAQACPAPVADALAGTESWYCGAGNQVLSGSAAFTGVRTVVVRGNLNINDQLYTGVNGELHIYVQGNVTFTRGSSTPVGKVFIYAPYGSCSTSAGTTITLTGAIACRSVDIPASGGVTSTITHQHPTFANPTLAPYASTPLDSVYALESPAYVDGVTAAP